MPFVENPPLPVSNNPPPSSLYIGLMSGTSLDGVDGVLIDLANTSPKILSHCYLPFDIELKNTLLALNHPGRVPNELEAAALATNQLTKIYANCVDRLTQNNKHTIRAIGCHGQTIRHQPDQGFTIQLMNGALLSELTGLDTICDFRSKDIAAGGQGAPLVPKIHQAWFSHPQIHRYVVNLGGIANITSLHPKEALLGFDCGPANILLDAWIDKTNQEPYDRNGAFAKTGIVNSSLLHQLLAHPFLTLPPPKSTGRETFNLEWLLSQPGLIHLKAQDVQATLTEFTAKCVTDAILTLKKDLPIEVLLCGGGAFNCTLIERIKNHLPNTRVTTTAEFGIPVEQMEAAAFAWLAYAYISHVHGNAPSVTGANHPAILGALYRA